MNHHLTFQLQRNTYIPREVGTHKDILEVWPKSPSRMNSGFDSAHDEGVSFILSRRMIVFGKDTFRADF